MFATVRLRTKRNRHFVARDTTLVMVYKRMESTQQIYIKAKQRILWLTRRNLRGLYAHTNHWRNRHGRASR